MTDQNPADPQTVAQIRADLHEFAQRLREGKRLDEQARQNLASLLDELGAELDPAAMPSAQTIQLAELTSQLARSLHDQQQASLLTPHRDRLVDAARWAETHAPAAAGIVNRFIDVLTSIGI